MNLYRPAFPGRSIFITGVGRARPRFAPARISACCAQPLYLLTPPGRFALRAGAHRAHASFRRPCGSLWAFGPTAHRAGASLRCRAGNLRPWTLSIYRKRPVAPPFLDMLKPPEAGRPRGVCCLSTAYSAAVSAAGTSKVGAKPLSTIRSYTFWV